MDVFLNQRKSAIVTIKKSSHKTLPRTLPKQIKSQLWMFAIGVKSLNIGSVYKVIGCYVECNVVRF